MRVILLNDLGPGQAVQMSDPNGKISLTTIPSDYCTLANLVRLPMQGVYLISDDRVRWQAMANYYSSHAYFF